jgi:hypothetical protein
MSEESCEVLWILFVVAQIVIGLGNGLRVGHGRRRATFVAKLLIFDFFIECSVSGAIGSEKKCYGKVSIGGSFECCILFYICRIGCVSGCMREYFGDSARM